MLFHATKTPLEERLRSVPPAQSPPASAVPREKGVETHPQPGRDHGRSQSPLGSCSSHHQPPGCFSWEDIYKYALNCTPGWGPCSTSSWSPPTRAVWPMGLCKHGVPFPGLPIQPFLLICLRPGPSAFPQLPSAQRRCPRSLCGLLLSCAEGPLLGSLHCQEMSPTMSKRLLKLFLLVQAGAPKSAGLLAEVRHQDLALRTDICKSVFLFLLPLCFSNKDKATRKKGTWNSVKNTQKGSTNSQITNKTNKKTPEHKDKGGRNSDLLGLWNWELIF